MAREIKVGLGDYSETIVVNVEGQEQVRAVLRTIQRELDGLGLAKLYGDEKKLVDGVTDSLRKFTEEASKANAENLVKSLRALSGFTGKDWKTFFPNSAEIQKSADAAYELAGSMSNFSIDNFRDAATAFEAMGGGFEEFQRKIEGIISSEASLRKRNEELTSDLASARTEISRLSESVDTLTDDLEDVRRERDSALGTGKIKEFTGLISKARSEFNAFLDANNIDRNSLWDDEDFTRIFDDIENGAITSGEAIARFKSKFRELLPKDASIGVETLFAKLTEIAGKMDQLEARTKNLRPGGAMSEVTSAAQESVGAIEGQQQAVEELIGLSPAVDTFSKLLLALAKSTEDTGEETSRLSSELKPLFDMLRSFSSTDAGKLQSLGRIFNGISDLGGIKIYPATLKNLQAGLEGLSTIDGVSVLKELSDVDLRKFNELKVNKASLENLATYLPVIASVDADNLKKLEGLDLSVFSGLKVPDVSTDSISSLAEFGKALTETVTGVNKLTDSLNVAGVSGAASLQNLVNNGLSRGQIGSVLKSGLGANGTFTTKTSLQHIGMTADEADRIATQLGEMYGNIKNVSAEWKTFADGSRDAAVITVKAIGDVGETLSQKLIYTLREVKDEAGNVRKEWKLDEVGKVSVDYSAVEKSLADSQKLADQMANGREAAAKQRLAEEQKIADAEKKAAQDAIDAEYKRAEAAVEADKKAYEAFVREQEAKERAAQKEYEAAMKVAEARQQAEEKQNASDEERKIAELGDQYESLADSIEKSATALRGPWSEVSDEHKNDLLEIQNALQTSKEWYDNGLLSTEDYAEVLNGLTQAYNTLDRAVQESSVSQKKAATEERRATKETLDSLNARRSVNNEVRNATRILNEYSAAEHSHNQSSREAYKQIGLYRAELQNLNAKYSAGEMSLEEYNQKWREYSGEISRNAAIIELNGDAHMTAFGKIGRAIKTHLTTLSATTIIGTIMREIRQMVEAVKEIDTSMTELRKVTDETDARYEKFLTDAATRAKALSATISDTVSATADFARLGLSIDEAEAAADAAIVYKSVGDNIESIGDAAESIISTMKAFGIEATDAMSIVDKFNKVGKELCPAA